MAKQHQYLTNWFNGISTQMTTADIWQIYGNFQRRIPSHLVMLKINLFGQYAPLQLTMYNDDTVQSVIDIVNCIMKGTTDRATSHVITRDRDLYIMYQGVRLINDTYLWSHGVGAPQATLYMYVGAPRKAEFPPKLAGYTLSYSDDEMEVTVTCSREDYSSNHIKNVGNRVNLVRRQLNPTRVINEGLIIQKRVKKPSQDFIDYLCPFGWQLTPMPTEIWQSYSLGYGTFLGKDLCQPGEEVDIGIYNAIVLIKDAQGNYRQVTCGKFKYRRIRVTDPRSTTFIVGRKAPSVNFREQALTGKMPQFASNNEPSSMPTTTMNANAAPFVPSSTIEKKKTKSRPKPKYKLKAKYEPFC